MAAGWAIGVIGNLTWGIYNVVSDSALPPFSFLDVLFSMRDVLHLVAFLRIAPARMAWRQAAMLVAAVLVVLVAMLGGYIGLQAAGLPVSADYWGGAIYPVLETGVLAMALMRWRLAEERGLRRMVVLMMAAVLFYFVANVFQFMSLASGGPESLGALILWPLSDLTALAAAILLLRGRASTEAVLDLVDGDGSVAPKR
jgi:hypothetical protein